MSPTNLVANTYNPHNQSPDELINGFVVRTKEFESLYTDIKTDTMRHPPQHVIIQGRRGSGKTSFLLRTFYEVKRDESVNGWLLPLVFNEEMYSVRTLYKLWEHVAGELGDNYGEFINLYDTMQARSDASDYEEICFDLLISALKEKKKKLLLLVDNVGDMLQKFSEREQRRLREILITCADIKIVGASSVALESTFEYDKPFFEFFRIIDLPGLSKQETTTLLLALGEKYGKEQIKKIIHEQPGKIEALRRLTDGVPRTMILLFEIFIDDAAGDSFRDLDMVLDRVTPLYKHRMDDLSSQQQEIVEIIALQWDAISVKEIARKSRMESKAVSAQLRLLEKNRITIKKQTSTKNHLYQISERFFNIWYLMRCGRKRDRRVQWLTRFMEEWCSREELVERAGKHLEAMKGGVVCEPGAFYMTEALVRTRIPSILQDSLIKEARLYFQKKGSLLVGEISKSDLELIDKAKNCYRLKEYELAIKIWDSCYVKNEIVFFNMALCYHRLKKISQAEKYYMLAIENGNADAMYNLALLNEMEKNDLDQAEKYYLMAIEKGIVSAMHNLGLLYEVKTNGDEQAEKYLIMAFEHGHKTSGSAIAILYFRHQKNKVSALEYSTSAYKRSSLPLIQLTHSHVLLWNDDIEKSTEIAKPLFEDTTILDNEFSILQYLLLLIAKKQYSFAHRLFTESPLDLRGRYRPIYYALMYFMQDTHPDEYKKMGSELQETVMEIIAEIKKMAETM